MCACRRTYGDIEELRRAVKLEVAQLELQLTELVRHCADSFKTVTHSSTHSTHSQLFAGKLISIQKDLKRNAQLLKTTAVQMQCHTVIYK